MDSILIPNNTLYLAENSVRSFTTPTYIPAIIYTAITGCLAVAFYEKFVRKEYFLPYLYFGNTALLYSISHLFLIIFVTEENAIEGHTEEESSIDFSHEYALYNSIIIAACGSFFMNIALFRLLEVWVRKGQGKNSHLASYYLGVAAALFSSIPVVFSIAGDAVLVNESSHDYETAAEVKKAIVLKLAGALFNVVLVLLYILLCAYYAWSVYRIAKQGNNQVESQSPTASLIVSEGSTDFEGKASYKAVGILFTLGTLVMLRFVYDLYIVIVNINFGPIWDLYAYLVLVIANGTILLTVAYLSDLTVMKKPIRLLRPISTGYYLTKEGIPNGRYDPQEAAPLSKLYQASDQDGIKT